MSHGWTIHSTVPYPVLSEPGTAALLAGHGVGPEIYFSAAALDGIGRDDAQRRAEDLRAAGIFGLTFHAPFEDLSPGARDEEVRRISVRRLKQALALAPLFRPAGVVMHGGYFEWLYDFEPTKWLEPARRTFCEIAEAAETADTCLFLENVFDEVPDHLIALRDAVGSKRLFFCFDAGHATLFSRLPIQKWLEALGPAVRELHIHDNRGLRDDHLPAGEGTINFRGVLQAALDAGARPILTIEPHRREHFYRGVTALRRITASL